MFLFEVGLSSLVFLEDFKKLESFLVSFHLSFTLVFVSSNTLSLPGSGFHKAICGNWEVNNPFQMLCNKCYAFFPPSTGIIWEDSLFFFFFPIQPLLPPPFLCLVALEKALVMNCYSNVLGLLLVLVLFTVWLCVYVQRET